ncbi:hypothetical protein VFPPC_18693 [Pochonia chlamydosporia 170]|uniref:Uncharacterized protein n=1 Tax=Pochonia chlamydosporia 170 TaxID=1380566 RepID=A0A219AS40_METCM|nr:hypothetical protein VFPPC_18693 [Pochonia chlamydosporia 170]OWT43580.1 hypothetical protein VFPPC_18693 [Pochonia chlamydosporia 170]
MTHQCQGCIQRHHPQQSLQPNPHIASRLETPTTQSVAHPPTEAEEFWGPFPVLLVGGQIIVLTAPGLSNQPQHPGNHVSVEITCATAQIVLFFVTETPPVRIPFSALQPYHDPRTLATCRPGDRVAARSIAGLPGLQCKVFTPDLALKFQRYRCSPVVRVKQQRYQATEDEANLHDTKLTPSRCSCSVAILLSLRRNHFFSSCVWRTVTEELRISVYPDGDIDDNLGRHGGVCGIHFRRPV